MTFGAMYTLAMSLWDKALSPYLPQQQFDDIINVEYNNWIEAEYEKLEANQKYDMQLAVLFTTYIKANSSTIDFISDLAQPLRYRIRFYTTYNDSCYPNIPQESNPVYPATNDEIDTMRNDSFWQPTDLNPVVVITQLPSTNPGYKLYSATTPLTMNLTYIRQPQTINSATAPTNNFEMPDSFARWIIENTVERADILIENFDRASAEGKKDAVAAK